MQMGNAATKYGIRIQYCMPYVRHLLQSVEIPSVTQIRVSDDNVPGASGLFQWIIGETSMLTFNLGLAPFKDGFLTKVFQDGCKFMSPN